MRIPFLILCMAAASFGQVAEVQWHAAGSDGRRYEARVEATAEPLQLLIRTTRYSYEILVDGLPLGRTQTVEPQIFDVPAQGGFTLTLIAPSPGPPLQAWTGTPQSIQAFRPGLLAERLRATQPRRLLSISLLTGGLFFLIIPLWRPQSSEYFWCGLYLILGGTVRALGAFPEAFGITANATVFHLNNWISFIQTGVAWPLFCLSLLRSRLGWLGWAAIATNFVVTAVNIIPGIIAFAGVVRNASEPFIYLDTLPRRSGSEKLGPMHWALGLFMTASVLNSVISIRDGANFGTDLFSISLSYSILAFMFAMALLMNRRAASIDQEQGRLKQELLAAAEVQALILPQQSFQGVETVYLPAAEVGGDFYQILERPDGSRVALLGDVSGKGLKAAMLVSVAIGALRREKSSSPAEILAGLNEALLGQGGFVTCCCVRYAPHGELTVASAGHPAPYCDGREVEVVAGLPLGVVAEADWEETRFALQPGAQVTLVSDGVVEAENSQRELFGFDRTRAISGKSAQEIADAAKAWGQNDDITVVTVRRLS